MSSLGQTKSPTAKGKPAATASRPNAFARFLQGTYQPAVLLPAALCLGAVITRPWLSRWLPDISRRSEFALRTDHIRLASDAPWLPRDYLPRLAATAEIPADASVLDPTIIQRLAGALRADPWVRSLREIRQHRDGGISIDADFRRPVLMVQTATGVYPLDREAVLLPPQDFTVDEVASYPQARNATSLPSGPAGTVWSDPAIQGAAKLAEELSESDGQRTLWQQFTLQAILLPSPAGIGGNRETPLYVLLTTGGSNLLWGRAPGLELNEPSAEQKIERLRYYLQQRGSFETDGQPTRINILLPESIVAEPLPRVAR